MHDGTLNTVVGQGLSNFFSSRFVVKGAEANAIDTLAGFTTVLDLSVVACKGNLAAHFFGIRQLGEGASSNPVAIGCNDFGSIIVACRNGCNLTSVCSLPWPEA